VDSVRDKFTWNLEILYFSTKLKRKNGKLKIS
jgi:hypothetical protein